MLANVVNTYVRLSTEEKERFAAELEQEAKEVQDMVITWEDALAESRAEGEARGRQVIRDTIVRLAQHKSGPVPPSFRERLETIDDLDRLDGVLDQVLNARSLDDVDLD